jgi:hypothetical protein
MPDTGMLIVSIRQDAEDKADAEQELANIKRALIPIEGLQITGSFAAKLDEGGN